MSLIEGKAGAESEPAELGFLGAIGSQLSRFRCPGCGYGATSKKAPERCPMCSGTTWDQEPWRPLTGPAGETV